MLMMLAGFGRVRKNQGQLTLIMLAGFGHGGKTRAADAHDAGRVWKYWEKQVQLMLMMPAGFVHIRKTGGSWCS